MLQWLEGARTPPKYLIIRFQRGVLATEIMHGLAEHFAVKAGYPCDAADRISAS
jgi:hypothetical protein